MLEVCFNESVKGALAVAQRCENSVGGTVGIIADKKLSFFAVRKALKEYRKRQDELQKSAVPLGGKREDIAGICLMLSEGISARPFAGEIARGRNIYARRFPLTGETDGRPRRPRRPPSRHFGQIA